MATASDIPPKPIKRHHHAPAYSWAEIERYVEAKYRVDLRDYKTTSEREYRDFWIWMLEVCNIQGRDSYFNFPEDWEGRAGCQGWHKEIMGILLTEFPDLLSGDIYVDW